MGKYAALHIIEYQAVSGYIYDTPYSYSSAFLRNSLKIKYMHRCIKWESAENI